MRDKLIDYYENCRSHYTTYHNHKEISAWAGLALFVFFAGFVNLIKVPETLKFEGALIVTLLVCVVALLVFRYISAQLEMKDVGGSYVAAAIAFITDLISGEISDEKLHEYLHVKESPDLKAQSRHVLPQKFIEKAEVLNTRGRGFQDTTKAMIYGILALVAMLLITSKWIQVLG